MALKFVLYIATFSVFAHCSVISQRGRHTAALHNVSAVPDIYISGGQPAEIGQFPWIVRLSITNSDGTISQCAGSLIGVRHVLTAAHCLEGDIQYNDIEIYLGEYDVDSYPVDCARRRCTENKIVYPDKIMVHDNYDSVELDNDIALLRLRKRAPLTAYIKVMPLPPFDIDQPRNNGMSVAVIGWGETESSEYSNILLATEVTLIPKRECDRKAWKVPAKHLCAGDDKGRGTCIGDSGGPLLMYHNNKFYISGIVSYGSYKKCGTARIGFYTNVFKYIKWIKQHMRA